MYVITVVVTMMTMMMRTFGLNYRAVNPPIHMSLRFIDGQFVDS